MSNSDSVEKNTKLIRHYISQEEFDNDESIQKDIKILDFLWKLLPIWTIVAVIE